jgi:asparagine synthase (glutamine-hydrolysing)
VSGICVVVHWNDRPIDPHTIHAMTTAAHHRGPDGIHTWTTPTTALAHLANHITPEDQHDHQPHTHHHLTITADARIDNRDHLIPLLHAKGHLPTTNPTDSQLILAAHHHWGTDAPTHLIGDYAYAIYDTTTHTLTAARDPMGMRPLYYRTEPHRLLIASEIKQLLAAPDVPAALHEPMLAAHLAGPYGDDTWTFYAGIDQLAPGRALLACGHGMRCWQTWDVDPGHRVRYRTEDDYVQHFVQLFREAVQARTRAAKPVGLMLSGGVDSGGVAGMLGALRRHDRRSAAFSYTWAFDDASLVAGDERALSDAIAQHAGLTTRHVPADDAWPLRGYPDHGPHRDAPYVYVYQALIERTLALARADGVGPLLWGDRGDEVVGDRVFDHPGMLLAGAWRSLAHELLAHAAWSKRSLRSVLRRDLLAPLLHDLGWRAQPTVDDAGAERLIPPYVRSEWSRSVGLRDIVRGRPLPTGGSSAQRARRARISFNKGMRDPVLQERNAASFGMAYADPWADTRLVRYVLAIPQWLVQRPSAPKRLARLALREVLPPKVVAELGKTEPAPLFERGFKDRSRATISALLSDMQLEQRGFVDAAIIRELYDDYLAGAPLRHDLWWPLTLEMWLRRYWA